MAAIQKNCVKVVEVEKEVNILVRYAVTVVVVVVVFVAIVADQMLLLMLKRWISDDAVYVWCS